jgi:hypothetical protein
MFGARDWKSASYLTAWGLLREKPAKYQRAISFQHGSHYPAILLGLGSLSIPTVRKTDRELAQMGDRKETHQHSTQRESIFLFVSGIRFPFAPSLCWYVHTA